MLVDWSEDFELRKWPFFSDRSATAVDDFIDFAEKQSSLTALISAWPGKISPSWKTSDLMDVNYCKKFNLWHAHSGEPKWNSVHGKYKTSKMVIHFMKVSENTIKIVDYTSHADSNKKFPIPGKSQLESLEYESILRSFKEIYLSKKI